MTTVKCVTLTELEVSHNGRIVRIPIANFVAIDGGLHQCAARAQEQVGVEVEVPSKSYARGLRPRNYGACGVRQ